MPETIRDIIHKYQNAIADATALNPELAGNYIDNLINFC